MDQNHKLYFLDHLSASQESLSSFESSIGSEGLGPLAATTLVDLCRTASALLPVKKEFSSELVTHSLSQSTSSSEVSSLSRNQSPSKLSDNKCHICSYITNRRSNLLRHLETMHKNQQDHSLECCDTMFSSKSELREHKRQSHANGYGCLICSRTFCRRALLKRHMNVHSGQKDFTCGSCDYATSHKSNLERHIFRLHGESAGNSYKATRTPHAKRRLSDDKSMEYSAKRYQSLSSLDNLELEDVKPGFMNLPGISFATGKPRLCATNYSCSSCNLAFGSQIESSLHSRTCEILKNCEKDMVRAAFILLQLKHSRESLN